MLSGFRVVELGVWVAGPSAGGVLADWGADVVKVEAPEGDPFRHVFAKLAGLKEPTSPPFDLDNRGKRSVVIDLRTDDGRAALTRLVDTADVFLTNLRPEALSRLGLGPDDLLPDRPRLVYASVSGYGLSGPDRDRPGYDIGAFHARAGVAASMTPPGGTPPIMRGGVGDHVTGITTVAGIVAALLHRERTGQGQLVETSLLRTGIYCIGWDLGIHMRFGKLGPAEGRSAALNPLTNCYRAADDRWFWLLGLEADRHWPRLLEAIDRPDLDDERFGDARSRRHNREDLIAILDAVFASEPRDVWAQRFDAHDVWWAPVQTIAEVLEDPQARAAGAFVDVPGGPRASPDTAVATPVRFGTTEAGPAGPSPALDEHTDAVLADLGYGPAEIERLRAARAVGVTVQADGDAVQD